MSRHPVRTAIRLTVKLLRAATRRPLRDSLVPHAALAAPVTLALLGAVPVVAQAQRFTVRDSAGVPIVTSTAPAWTPAQALRIDPVPRLVIGTQAGTPYELSRVAGAARLANGRIVIADGGSQQLRFYDRSGVFIKAASGPGAGPGEFRGLRGLTPLRGDTLALRGDRGKVAYFDGDGALLFEANHAIAPELRAGGRPNFLEVLATFSDGSAIVGTFGNPAPRPGVARWLETFPVTLVDRRNATIRSLGDIPLSVVVMDGAQPRPPWFAAPLAIANDEDTFFIGLGTEYSIRVYGRDGRLSRIIRRPWTPVPVTSRDIDTYVVEWGKRWIKATGAEAERQRADLRDDPYETSVPAYSRFIADRVGRLWVRAANIADAPGAGQLNTTPLVPSVWSVFAPDGSWLGDVTLPARFQPHDIGADYVLGTAIDADGVQTVVNYALMARG